MPVQEREPHSTTDFLEWPQPQEVFVFVHMFSDGSEVYLEMKDDRPSIKSRARL